MGETVRLRASRSILVVDDEVHICRTIALNLKRCGYTVRSVNTAADAILEVEESRRSGSLPDMIICDLNLPDLSGLELLERMQTRELNFAVIVMSGYMDDSTRSKLREIGCRHFLSKPFGPDELFAVITHISAESCHMQNASSQVANVPE